MIVTINVHVVKLHYYNIYNYIYLVVYIYIYPTDPLPDYKLKLIMHVL